MNRRQLELALRSGKRKPAAGGLLWALALLVAGTAWPYRAQAVTYSDGDGTVSAPYTYRCFEIETAFPNQQFLFGVINDVGHPNHYSDEWERGVRATTLELQWRMYEPQQGVVDVGYADHLKGVMRSLKARGWYVQLVPGYHYVPDWVFASYPDTYYVNQYGERYDPDPITQASHRVINAPFNPQARALIAGYVERIFSDFDQSDPGLKFDSVRVGGGVQGELRYPPSDENGHGNSYWAFDGHAQNPATAGIPPAVVGWRPGIDPNPGSVGRGQLIVNPGFEDAAPDHPILAWSPDDEVSARVASDVPRSGSGALELTISTPNRIHQYVRVEPNSTYNLGGWLRSRDGKARARIIVTQYDANTHLIANAPFVKLETNSTSWLESVGSLTTSSTTRFLKVAMDGDQAGTYHFDDLWLKRDGESNDEDRDVETPLAFYDWYVQALTDYQNWQISEIRKYYAGQLDVLYAGKGVRSNQVTDALTNDLRGDGWSERSRALYSAALYERHVSNLIPKHDIALYLTGIEEPAPDQVDDHSPYPGDWSAARWIAHLARQQGMAVWGENSGQDDAEALTLSAQRMLANGFLGLMWGFESELYAIPNPNAYATIAQYEAVIAAFSAPSAVYLPLTVRIR